MRMHKHRPAAGAFERMNARRERGLTRLRCQMIDAAMAGGRSGFAVQMRMGGRLLDSASATVGLREARPRAR